MEIVGRITADATLKKLDDEREVVQFSVAVNDRYPSKDGNFTQSTTYFECAYWNHSKSAAILKKGIMVQVGGRLSVHPYIGADGNPKATLNFYVTSLTLLAWPKEEKTTGKENLPF